MRRDPLEEVSDLRVGVRVSLRLVEPSGPTDRIGLVVALDDAELTVEDRQGRLHRIARDTVRLARLVPTVARGRNPRHAPPEQLRNLARDQALQAPADAECWIARLCDIVAHLDDSGVAPIPGHADTQVYAACSGSRGLVNGEWSAVRLLEAESLDPLAAWAARRNARNIVLTSPLPGSVLTGLGLAPLAS